MIGSRRWNLLVDHERPGLAAWVLLVVGAIAIAVSMDGYTAATAENEQLLRQVERFKRKEKATVSVQARRTNEQKSVVAVRLETKAFPWDMVLREIELATDDRVALLSLETNAGTRKTRVGAEARNIDDALAFVSRLRESPLVREAFLLSHEAKKGTPVEVIGFTMEINWSTE
jgi:hypothetical protein